MARQIEAVIKLRDEASAQLKKLSKEASAASKSIDRLEHEVEGSGKAAKRAGRAQKELANETKKAGEQAERSADQFDESASKLDGFRETANNFAKAGLLAAGVGMIALAKGSIEAVSQLENFEVQLEVLLKDSKLAKERLEELFTIGATTPFELGDLVAADVIIQGFGADANVLRTGIMDLAGALNTDLQTAAIAVAKSFAAGAGASDGLRESYALLYTDVKRRAEEMGDPSDIKIWQQAMTDALQAVDGVVAGGTEKLAKTFRGKMSNMADNWFKLKVSIGKAGLFDFVSTGMKVMLEDVDKATDGVERLGKAMSDDLIMAMEGLIRVGALLAQGLLAIAIGIEVIIGAGRTQILIFEILSLKTTEAHLAFVRFMDSIASTPESAAKVQELRAEFIELDRTMQSTAQAHLAAIERIDRMSDAMFGLGAVGEKLDEIKRRTDALREAAAKGVKINVETTFSTKGGGPKSMAELIDIMAGPAGTPEEGVAPKTTTTVTGGGGGTGKAAKDEIDRLRAAAVALIPKQTVDRLRALESILWHMTEAATQSEQAMSRLDIPIQAVATAINDVKQQQRDLGEEVAFEEMFALTREMTAAGVAASRSALEISGAWQESDSLAVKIKAAKDRLAEFRERMTLLGVVSGDAAGSLASMSKQITALADARTKALEAERAAMVKAMPMFERIGHEFGELGGRIVESVKGGLVSATGDLVSAGLSLGGSIMKGVASVASQGIAGLMQAAGPTGAAVGALSSIGGMGYTKTEEYVDPRTGETKTRDVEVSAAEAIGEQMEGFLQGFITAIVEVVPDLIAEIIPAFIIDGIPALITGVLEAIPKIGMALFVHLPIALVKGLGQWWHDAWAAIRAFFTDVGGLFGKDAGKEWGKAGAGAAGGAAVGFAVGGPPGAAIGAAIGFVGGAVFHSGGYVDRTGPALLQQGERVVPSSGADTGTARGLSAFGGSGSNVTIHTNVIDPDSIDRLGVLLDEQFGSFGRNTLPIMG